MVPGFSKDRYSFVVGRQLVPDLPGGLISTIGDFNVSSVMGSVTLDLVRATSIPGSQEPAPLSITGLIVQGNKLLVSREFFLSLTTMTFPIQGYVRARDNRTQCVLPSGTTAGPCYAVVPFSLDVAEFNPSCPNDIYRFSSEEQQSVTWTEPKLLSISGAVLALTRTHAPGSFFEEKTTTVSYAAQFGQDPAQPLATRLTCSFTVPWLPCLLFLDTIE